MKRVILITLILAAVVLAATRVYDIEPFQNCNGKAREIGQTFVTVCDSFIWAEFFAGAKPLHPDQDYLIQIKEAPDGAELYSGHASAQKSYDYTRAYLTKTFGSPPLVKGKEYLLKITHTEGDSINYYYDSLNTYKYGYIVVGGLDEPGLKDLAARIEGINVSC
jgi:hypothetical protein